MRGRYTRRNALLLGSCAALAFVVGPASSAVQVVTARELSSMPSPLPADSTPTVLPPLPVETAGRQFRAAWIATVVNVDWPSKPGLTSEIQQQEFLHLLEELQRMHMNAVVVQVKPTADAFYPSEYGPWSQYLTGVQGQNPGYDPLAFMLEETHKRNMEFHAWCNPYRVSMQSDPAKLSQNHPARLHPDWLISYGGKLYYNPGIPATRTFILDSMMEIVRGYDIDAVHMDDYFYPYPVAGQDFPDEATYRQYGAEHFPQKADWRRDNVNQLMRDLAHSIKSAKSHVKLGVSPFGVWRNRATDPGGSDTTAGVQNYDDLYADTRTWIRNNWLDYIAPQIYWNIGFAPAAYEKLTAWWSREVAGYNVQLYVGQAAYKIPAWGNSEEMPNQLKLNQQDSAVKGSIFFSVKDLLKNPLGFKDRLTDDLYKWWALTPVMPWLGGSAPSPVVLDQMQSSAQGVALRWIDQHHMDAAYYAIYRFPDHQPRGLRDFADPQYLLTTVRKLPDQAQQAFVDNSVQVGKPYTYYVTALDRLHHESAPSNGRSI